ncbi:hypothetical protein SLS56_006775 [Neofusicoccum ribis]|uniref:G-protein coupled receptors family 2 profile 2 domain-containing protein n=1 Tax=Neofusicoccum ribis TaxID=45134 RepID=A0ABR3SQC5_9PEZI
MLRKLEPWYFGVIYGISALPALVYVILDMKPFNKGTIGPAGLWCWVSDKYEWARFAFLYIPLWVVVISALGIYVRVGILLIKMTLEVRSASNSSVWSVMSFSHFPPKGADNLPRRDESEQHLQPEDYVEEPERAARADGRRSSDIEMEPIQPIQTVESRSRSVGTIHITHAVSKQTADSGAYVPPVDPPALVVDRSKQRVDAVDREQVEQAQPQRQESRPWRRPENQAAWSYTKVAFLMFLALIIVWVGFDP